jgi:Txe/YoeB family toxin of Txe-Axe toxin-antitoxin module
MKLLFTESAWADYLWFQENDRRLLVAADQFGAPACL